MREQDLPVLEVYAEALMDAASKAGDSDALLAEARELATLLKGQTGLLLFLEKPAIETEDKKRLLRQAFEGQISPLLLNLSLMLVDKFRGGMWLAILQEFIAVAERERGIYAARVQTAAPLDDEQRGRLSKSLEEFTGRRLRIDFQESPDLLGGVLFRYGDTMVDASVRGALDEIRVRLDDAKID